MIATDGLSLMTVEKLGFKLLLKGLAPQFNLKSRKYYRDNVLPKLYEKLKRRIIEDLSNIDWIGLTVDCWESKSMKHSLLGMHFI